MADSLLTSLLGTLDNRSVGAVAGSLGESEHSVMRGLQTSIASILGSIAGKSEDSSFLRKIWDMCRSEAGDVSWSQLAGGVSDPNSSLISSGKRMLGTIFGGSESSVATAVSAESGLRPSSTSWILAMAAPMVMNFLGRRIRDEGMTAGGFGSLMQRESAGIRSALPPSLSSLFWPRAAAAGASPVIAQTVTPQKSHSIWPAALAILALALGLGWLFNRSHRPMMPPQTAQVPTAPAVPTTPTPVVPQPAPTGEASRMAEQAPINLTLKFDNASTKLRKDSMADLDRVAAAAKDNTNYHIDVAGYTDNQGSPERNMALSQRRANQIVAMLVDKGVPKDRITGEGHGEDNPVADNSTAEGRAENRRVTVVLTPR